MKILKLVDFELKKFLSLKKVIAIILILTLCSFGFIKFSEFTYNGNIPNVIYVDIETYKQAYEEAKKNFDTDNTAINLERLLQLEIKFNIKNIDIEYNINHNDWRYDVVSEISDLLYAEIPIKIYLADVDMTDYSNEVSYESTEIAEQALSTLEKNKENLMNIIENGNYYDYAKILLEREEKTLELLENDITLAEPNAVLPNYTAVSRLHDLVKQKNVSLDKIKLYDYIIDNKIDGSDKWKYVVVESIIGNLNYQYEILDNEEEFEFNDNLIQTYGTYENYLSMNSPSIQEATNKNNENWYYLEHNIEPLTLGTYELSTPYTTRLSMNNIYYMAIASLIITIIMCGGIIANEHKTGSIRLLLTKPYKRWKILLSKLITVFTIFIVLYIISYFITYILSGIMYGFNGFSIPLIINENGNLTHISYIYFTLKNMALATVICLLFLSLLFSLSSITLKSSISISLLLILIFILSLLPLMIIFDSIFTYIPFVLINFYEVLFPHFNTGFTNIDINTSIIVSLVMIFVITFITFVIYCKRDIKN